MNKRKYIGLIIILISLIVIFACIAYFLEFRDKPETSEEVYVKGTVKEKSESGIREIDFKKLLSENEDTIGWIEIPGTEIDYPVVTSGEDVFYIDHDFYGNWDSHGTIFVDDFNGNDFSQLHTVIYGHNMRDGSMFAGLHKYKSNDFFEKNRDIYIYTPDGKRKRYRIFAAYERDDAYMLKTYDYNNKEEHRKYIADLTSDVVGVSIIDSGMIEEIKPNVPIITLYTCTGVSEWRYIVQAVKVE